MNDEERARIESSKMDYPDEKNIDWNKWILVDKKKYIEEIDEIKDKHEKEIALLKVRFEKLLPVQSEDTKDKPKSVDSFINLIKLREELSKLEHEQWTHWTKYFLENLENYDNVVRWEKQSKMPYEKLSEKEKDSDRIWADKVIDLIKDFDAEDKK